MSTTRRIEDLELMLGWSNGSDRFISVESGAFISTRWIFTRVMYSTDKPGIGVAVAIVVADLADDERFPSLTDEARAALIKEAT